MGGCKLCTCEGVSPSLLEKREVFCNPRWAASAGAASVWCRHTDWGKSTHLYPPDLLGTFLRNHLDFTVPFDVESEHLAGNRRDRDCCDLKVRLDVNLRLSSMQVAWTECWRRFTDVFLFCHMGIFFLIIIIHQSMKYWPYLFIPSNSKIYSIHEVIIQSLSITEWTNGSQRKTQFRTLFEAREVAGSATYKQSKKERSFYLFNGKVLRNKLGHGAWVSIPLNHNPACVPFMGGGVQGRRIRFNIEGDTFKAQGSHFSSSCLIFCLLVISF